MKITNTHFEFTELEQKLLLEAIGNTNLDNTMMDLHLDQQRGRVSDQENENETTLILLTDKFIEAFQNDPRLVLPHRHLIVLQQLNWSFRRELSNDEIGALELLQWSLQIQMRLPNIKVESPLGDVLDCGHLFGDPNGDIE
ncbi:hypothetical protein KMW28_27315 [Flammeovirga yaeyamensis]|uniref:Uncharacterized protein n=1 Tax=Flammeovirga yaeyamensis TaxID=367791 RepID=A0AAX1NCE0_9BACT|nr:hypothetical protein [Flammeovirga yaeyamensis]MBB3700008.1 hypothetical protein [Flammeovirga yaeyamensis]NMF37554.1 hypothetical protein [Flammeovirga yaeyamensis]QWG04611.1 hypothetical protein KMW28_27315 [Flammeovirga yaeyamensis]